MVQTQGAGQQEHRLYNKGLKAYGFFEILRSSWTEILTEQNKIFYIEGKACHIRHFIITFHDSTFECLAADYKAKVDQRPYKEIISEISEIIANN